MNWDECALNFDYNDFDCIRPDIKFVQFEEIKELPLLPSTNVSDNINYILLGPVIDYNKLTVKIYRVISDMQNMISNVIDCNGNKCRMATFDCWCEGCYSLPVNLYEDVYLWDQYYKQLNNQLTTVSSIKYGIDRIICVEYKLNPLYLDILANKFKNVINNKKKEIISLQNSLDCPWELFGINKTNWNKYFADRR